MERKGSKPITAILLMILLTAATTAVVYAQFNALVGPLPGELPSSQHPETSEPEPPTTHEQSTAYDVCLSRNSDSEKWTTSHFKHCEHMLERCQESQDCLITYKENRSTEKYAHFHAEGDPLYLSWQVRLLADELPGFLTFGTNYPNSTSYEEGSIGWQIWKEGREKRDRLTGDIE